MQAGEEEQQFIIQRDRFRISLSKLSNIQTIFNYK